MGRYSLPRLDGGRIKWQEPACDNTPRDDHGVPQEEHTAPGDSDLYLHLGQESQGNGRKQPGPSQPEPQRHERRGRVPRDTVPVTALFDYLDSEGSLAEFLRDFPTVSREQVQATLRLAGRVLSGYVYEDSPG